MKKLNLLQVLVLLLVVLFPAFSFAEKVSEQEALKKAQTFMKGKKLQVSDKARRAGTPNEEQNQPYYVFNAEGNGGFVIISGDDRTPEVLGYANEGAFDIETAPANARWLMDYYEKSISSLDTDIQTKTFSKKAPANRSSVAPLVKTKWGQGNRGMAYNKYCPQVDGKKCFVGCVATAMAQIMNYHQWPVSATTAIGAYTTETENIYMPALSPTTFNWKNMTDDDIARLLLYCGQTVQMDYGPTTSYAYAEDAAVSFYEVFGYETGAHYIFRDDYADDDWEELMYNELRNYGPILYRGADPNAGGHIFICDGYDASNGLFSINWGWYGDCDGYFLLSQLKPGDDYSSGQGAVVGVRPPYSATINFVDDKVKALCVANWDTNGDGELSYVEAAAVTDLGTVFKGNMNIQSFNELQYFTGLRSIGDYAFNNCVHLSSVIIPNSVSSIGNNAFSACDLPSVTIPNSVVTIGAYGFYHCYSLTSVTIPSSVTSIGSFAFNDNDLASIVVESGNTVYDSRNNCNALIETKTNKLITGCKNTIVPSTVTAYEDFAFGGCKDMTSVVIPSTVVSIGESVFSRCDVSSIRVEDGNPVYDSRGNCNAIIETKTNKLVLGCKNTVIPNTVTSVGRSAFDDCFQLTSITIPNSVTDIGWYAFADCSGLTDVTISNSVTSIGTFTFGNCTNLRSVDIPNLVTSIGYYAFGGCKSLASITIPNSVASIGESAFFGANPTEITSMIKDVFPINDNVFQYWDNNERKFTSATLYVPAGTKAKYEATDGWKNFRNIVEMEAQYNFCPDDHHPHMIDLGLPSGTKWACCNVGADKPEGYGGYYAWGETEEKEKYSWETYLYGDGSDYGAYDIGVDIAGKTYDVAYVKQGSNWRMPTLDQMEEITSSCTSEWITLNDVKGLKITGSNGNSIFLPAAGEKYTYGSTDGLTEDGVEGHYWTSNCQPDFIGNARLFNFAEEFHGIGSYGRRDGVTVRAVASSSSYNEDVITFTDAKVKAICVENWDTNGDHELSKDEAAAVTDLGEVFRENEEITSFDELQYFTGLTSIGSSAFLGCKNLSAIIIPNSVKTIESYSFNGCKSLVSVTIPKGVIYIVSGAFWNCSSLVSFDVEEGNSVYYSENGILFDKNMTTIMCYPNGKPETTYAIPTSVTNIDNYAFADSYSLTSIIMPESVTKIGNYSFAHCHGLTSVIIGNSVTSIGVGAFQQCNNLNSVTIPNSVTNIERYAFEFCDNLSEIISYIEEPFALNNNVFLLTDRTHYSNATLYVPAGTKAKYAATDGWKNFTNIVEMGTGGDDMTNFIVNPGFEDGIQKATNPNGYSGDYGTATGWTADKNSYGNFTPGPLGSDFDDTMTRVLGAPNHCFEAWHCHSFDLWQEIENLPKGMYQLEVQGYVRCEAPTYVRGEELGNDYPSPVYLYMNNAVSQFPSVYSECPEDLGHSLEIIESWTVETVNGKQYPNSMGGAAQCFSWGMYKTTANGLIAKDGDKFRIGVKMNSSQDWWCVFDNFKLTYRKPTAEVVKPVLEEELAKYDLALLEGSDFYGQASQVLGNANTALASNDGVQMFDALVAVYDMSEAYLDALQNKEERTLLLSHDQDGINYSLFSKNDYNDVRYDNDETAYFRTTLTLDVTKDGTTNTYTVDDGPYVSDVASRQRPCMAINTQTRQMFIFDNSSDGYAYALDGYCYVTSLDNISFQKETVFTDANWGWWPKFKLSEGGQLTLTHFSFAGYYAMTSTRNNDGSWTTSGVDNISPDDYKAQSEGKPNVLVFSAETIDNIDFADSKVKAICVENWDTNGDHELSKDEAAAVTDIGEVFRENEEITSFNELKYFTGLTKISEAAFFGDYALKSVELPAGLTSIEHAAFGICSSLTSIFIPKNVTSINGTSFRDCTSLVEITVDGENPVYESPRGCNAIINKNTKTLVTGCKVTVVPDGVEIIGPSAFYGQYSIKELVLPASVKQIGYGSYDGCGFETLVIPNTVERIDYAAFWNCHSLATIKLPAKTPTLSSEICSNCMKLTEVISLNPNPTAISGDVFIVDFDGTMPDATLYVPNGSKAKYEATAGWKRFTKIVEADLMDPIEKGEKVDFEEVGSGTDLAGNIVDDVFINIPVGDGSYDADDKCLVVTKVSNDATVNTLVDKDPMSDEVKKGISGVIFKVPAGEGNVKVEAESTGGMTLKVKIGKAAPVEIALTGKASMKFPYDVSEPTYVYIYAGQSAAARGIQKTSTAGSLKLYSVAVVRATGIGDLNSDSEIDVTDVVELIDMVLAGIFDKAGDINEDGEVDVTDVVELIDMVLSGE